MVNFFKKIITGKSNYNKSNEIDIANIQAQATKESAQKAADVAISVTKMQNRNRIFVAVIGVTAVIFGAVFSEDLFYDSPAEQLEKEFINEPRFREIRVNNFENELFYHLIIPSDRVRILADAILVDNDPYEKALKNIALGKYDLGIRWLDIASSNGVDKFKINRAKAWAYSFSGEHQKANYWFNKAYQLKAKDIDIAWQTAFSEYNIGEYNRAEAAYIRIKEQLRQAKDTLSIDYGLICENLGTLYLAQGEFDKAENLFKKVISIRDYLDQDEKDKLVLGKLNLVTLNIEKLNYSKADSILDEIGITNTRADLIAAEVFINRGRLAYVNAEYDKAKKNLDNALDIANTVLDYDHPSTAKVYNDIGNWYQAQENWDSAESHYREALNRWTSGLGERHPLVSVALNNLAELYRVKIRRGISTDVSMVKIEEYYNDALSIRRSKLGDKHPWTVISMLNLAALFELTNKFDKAEKLLIETIDLVTNKFGSEYLDLAYLYNNLAEIKRRNLGENNIDSLYEKSIKIFTNGLGADHPNVAIVTYNRGEALANNGKIPDAIKYISNAILILDKNIPQSSMIDLWYSFLIKLLEKSDRTAEIEKWKEWGYNRTNYSATK